jgi:geranylgeranyl reductase family protein
MEQWDAIVVGAGPAGCAAAFDLAAAGRSVLLLDRVEFPRHKACAGGLTRKTLRALRYSVAPVTRATISTVIVERKPGESAEISTGRALCAMTVREELDDFCLRQTLARGARFARIGPILTIGFDGQGVDVSTADATFSARFLIGADGVHSRVRQLLHGDRPGWFRSGFALEAQVAPAPGGASDLIFAFDQVRRGYGWIFPKHDHLNVGLYTESVEETIDRNRLLAWIHSRFRDARIGHLTGQYLGFGVENAPPAEGRVLLTGDAGGFADPLTGEGIYGAVASGQAAAAAIAEEFRSGVPAQQTFAAMTAQLRLDLRLSASGARWFYSNPGLGFRALTAPLFRGAVINAYANGTKIAALANTVRRFAGAFTAIS